MRSLCVLDTSDYARFACLYFYLFPMLGSPRLCKPETVQYNVTISGGILSGDFPYLGEVSNMRECIELACKEGEGDLAYLLDDRCFLVKCYTTCDLVKVPHAESAAARLNWTGRASNKARTLKVTIFSLLNLVSPRFNDYLI